ncbi:hypothetical protein Scep_004820 [Stephania cephalantha]|uniref:Glycosyltransferases n=1 Tax=Stephania cephalantha TaxID=152367 RepID=A0AAP0PZH3_9MAGN
MGSLDRSKKRVQLWKKAAFHFLVCFVMGFFTGFAPSGPSSIFSNRVALNQTITDGEFSPLSIEAFHEGRTNESLNRSLEAETPVAVPSSSSSSIAEPRTLLVEEDVDQTTLVPLKQLIIVTGIRSRDLLQVEFLRRLGYTLKLVAPPLLWIVVVPHSDSNELSEMLRKTGVMYRHLVYKENFTDSAAEIDHQRNVALNHIEHHRLSGIVHFAGIYNFYDLEFFQSLREIEVFGTWPMAVVSANRKKVVVEGPVCTSSQVVGWNLKKMMRSESRSIGSALHISSFAFNSSILWDPERWGRSSSTQETSQNSIKIVQDVVVEEEAKLKALPNEDCSKIMVWNMRIPKQPINVHPSLLVNPSTNPNWR